MVRHLVRQVVQLGHFRDFMTAMKAWNDAAPGVGLPTYRVWGSTFGVANEVFTEAEYESIQASVDAVERGLADEDFFAISQAVNAHLIDGSLRDYILSEQVL